jgi:replicative DNA helicase
MLEGHGMTLTAVKDENDKLQAGQLTTDPRANTKPANKAAEARAAREAADAARVLTVRQVLESAAKRSKQTAAEAACTTGHYELDEATGGIRPGKAWLFGAETSWGKSTWLVSVVDENLLLGKRVLIVTSEDDEDTYGARLLARRSGVTARRIRSGKLFEDDEIAIEREIANAENLPVFLDARGRSVEWTARKVEGLIDSENIDLVAYDYLQEWSAQREQENHRLTVKYIAKTLRTVVKLKKRASITFSQLTIDEKTKSATPNRNMIRDCRDVANAAEVIIIGYTPEKAVMDGERVVVPAGARAIWVDKVKDGPKKFAILMTWDDTTASFVRVLRPIEQQSQRDLYGGGS